MTEAERLLRRISGGELPKGIMPEVSEFCVVNGDESDKCKDCEHLVWHYFASMCQHPMRHTAVAHPECQKTCPKNSIMIGGLHG